MQQIPQFSSITAIKTPQTPPIFPIHQIKSKTHIKKPIISTKWPKKKYGSQRSHKFILNSIAFFASNLKILPEPFDSLVKDFWVLSNGGNGGNGGKIWFKNVFRNDDGRRNNRREKLGFWVMVLISSSLGLWVFLERENECDLVLFGVFLLAICFGFRVWRREMKSWVFGFCCGVALMGLGLRNNESFVSLVEKFRVCSSRLVGVVMKKRRRRRWI